MQENHCQSVMSIRIGKTVVKGLNIPLAWTVIRNFEGFAGEKTTQSVSTTMVHIFSPEVHEQAYWMLSETIPVRATLFTLCCS